MEAVLEGRPEFFYAEQLLGTWHRLNGDAAEAERYMLQSYRHAPVVLIQRYAIFLGSPVATFAAVLGSLLGIVAIIRL